MRNPLVAPSPLAARYGGIGHGKLSVGVPDFPRLLLSATAWYRSDRLITLNGSTVSAWGDLTGNSNDATQGTEANQPTYTASAINGKPGLTTDGSSDHMRADSVSSVVDGEDQPFSIAFATEYTSGTDTRILGFGNSASADHWFEILANLSGKWNIRARDGTTTISQSTSSNTDTNPHVHIITCTGTTVTWLIDNNTEINAAAFDHGSRTLDRFTLFALLRDGSTPGNNYNGVTTEIVLDSREWSSAEKDTIGQYMAKRYGTTWT